MKFLMVLMFTMFSLLTLKVHAINIINQSTKAGQVDSIKCADGVKCEKVLNNLKLSAYHATAITFASADTTPSVLGGTFFNTYTDNTVTITDFDDGVTGKEIIVKSKGPVTFDVTSSGLLCGSTDLATSASGDISRWVYDGTDWNCTGFTDYSDNLN